MIGALLATLVVWSATAQNESVLLNAQTTIAARATAMAVSRQLETAQRAVLRMTRYSVGPDSVWRELATQIVADVDGLQALVWLDAQGRVTGGDRHGAQAFLPLLARMTDTVRSGVVEPRSLARMIPLDSAGRYVAFRVPRPRTTSGQQHLVAILDATVLLQTAMPDTGLGYAMAIGAGSGWIHGTHRIPTDADTRVRTAPVAASNGLWQVGIWPVPRNAGLPAFRASTLTLYMGITLSILLGVALRLAQTVSERARTQEMLRHAETFGTVGRLAARIAHEINNPLAGIQSAFLLIRDAVPEAHPHRRYLRSRNRPHQSRHATAV
jgi:signal transduction histidine kinase